MKEAIIFRWKIESDDNIRQIPTTLKQRDTR